MHRISMLQLSGAFGAAAGSSNALWKLNAQGAHGVGLGVGQGFGEAVQRTPCYPCRARQRGGQVRL